MPWLPLVLAGAAAVLLAATQDRDRLLVLRLDEVILAVGAAFLLDDPTEETLAHVPTSLLRRRAVRVALAVPLLSLAWWQALAVAPAGAAFETPVPGWPLTLEIAALVAWALALSAGLSRWVPERFGGVVAGPTLAVLVALSVLLPERLRLWVSPEEPLWHHAHRLWAVALTIGVALFVWWSRDPWRRRWVRRPP
jgi:hypothetical protein